MELKIQTISIMVSILYGMFFGVIYNLCCKFLYINKLRYKVLNSLLFSIDIILIYFIIMLKIDYGNINIVFLLLVFISFILTVNSTKKIRKFVKSMKT